jgi:hypothetical protein
MIMESSKLQAPSSKAMRERPILFSAEMVRAILAGRKTQTRRIINPQPLEGSTVGWSAFSGETHIECRSYAIPHQSFIKVPYGKKGDRLWVRETFQPIWATEAPGNWKTGEGYAINYPATDGIKEWVDETASDGELTRRCKPAIHMPRWASRITLEIVRVRVERVQEITEGGVAAEGFKKEGNLWHPMDSTNPIYAFELYWDLLNDKRGFGWEKNPWVWVIEFKWHNDSSKTT